MNADIKVELSGPLFDARAPKALRDAASGALREMVEEGESFLMETLRPAPAGVYISGESTGNYRRNVSSRTQGMTAVISDGGVVYGPWLEGISSRNAASRFKGHASFRRAGQHVARLSKKIAEKYIFRAVRKMNM